MEVLALQPASLQTHIIAQSNAMLNLLATIKQRETAATGDVIKNTTGQPQKFTPNFCRDKCPIKPSQKSNDETVMKTLLEAANKEHDTWKQSMCVHAKNVSELEISIRNTKLRELFYKFVKTLALTTIVSLEIEMGGFPAGAALTNQELVHMAAYSTMATFSLENATFIGFANDEDGNGTETASNKLASNYACIMSFDVTTAKNKADVASDGMIVLKSVKRLAKLIPLLAIDHWRFLQDKEQKREINAAIKLVLAPAAKKTATEEVKEVLVNLDATNPSKQLLALIDKRTQAGLLAKIKQDMKRDLREKTV